MSSIKVIVLLAAVALFCGVQARHLQTESEINPENLARQDVDEEESLSTTSVPETDSTMETETQNPVIVSEAETQNPEIVSHKPPRYQANLPAVKLLEKIQAAEPTTPAKEFGQDGEIATMIGGDNETPTVDPDSEIVDLVEGTGSGSPKDQQPDTGVFFVQVPSTFLHRVSYVTTVPDSRYLQSAPAVIPPPVLAAGLAPEIFSYSSLK